MAGLCVHSALVTGANRGIGLGIIKQLLQLPNPPKWVFAACWDPKGERAQVRLSRAGFAGGQKCRAACAARAVCCWARRRFVRAQMGSCNPAPQLPGHRAAQLARLWDKLCLGCSEGPGLLEDSKGAPGTAWQPSPQGLEGKGLCLQQEGRG